MAARSPKGFPVWQFRPSWFLLGLAVLLTVASGLSGWSRSSEAALRLMRDGLQPRAASQQVVIVEIDARSLAALGRWPWPRTIHARLVDQLRRAGASLIAFDVDFSSASEPRGDDAFAQALARVKGRVVLPTFRQAASAGATTELENLPLAAFRPEVMLASVNVQTERNGQLVAYSYGTRTGGVPRPSIAAVIANASGRIGDSFRIDSAIDPTSIPRLSVVDVLDGRFDARVVRGRAILVGGTAIEMGDRYALPRHGVLPGVVAQALAAETLIAGTGGGGLGPWPALLLVLAALAVLHGRTRRQTQLLDRAVLGIAVLAAPLLTENLFRLPVDVVPALALIVIDATLAKIVAFTAALRNERATDPVTGLPNLRAFEKALAQLDQAVVVAARLHRFEALEAVLGEGGARALATRLVERLALAFPCANFFATAPGCVAWIEDGSDAGSLVARIEAACALFGASVEIAGRAVPLTPSFGLCAGEVTGHGALLAQASLAARQGEVTGRRWSIHGDATSDATQRELTLLADLDAAIDAGDVFVVYQPKLCLSDKRVSGAEALVRWKHPTLGVVPPDHFIPLLESSGNIGRLTLAVLDRALAEVALWRRSAADMNVAVNVSAALLDDLAFVRAVHDRLDRHGALAGALTLEVTESAEIEHADRAIAALVALRARGVRVSIDDYGTGRATMTYLRNFPADELKIDRSFIMRILDDASDQIMVRSTIQLALELNLKVVAEGVEDPACLAMLAQFGCHFAQGWAIGKPMTAEAFFERVSTHPDETMAA